MAGYNTRDAHRPSSDSADELEIYPTIKSGTSSTIDVRSDRRNGDAARERRLKASSGNRLVLSKEHGLEEVS